MAGRRQRAQRPIRTGLRFLAGGIGKDFKTPALLSIYVSKKRAPWPLAYLSISKKNGRLTFFASPPHAFVGFLKDEKWHVGPGFTPVSCKNSRGNGPHSCLRWPRLGFSSHFLQPIYLSLQKTSASPLGLSIYLSKYRAPLKFQLYLRKKNAIQVLVCEWYMHLGAREHCRVGFR